MSTVEELRSRIAGDGIAVPDHGLEHGDGLMRPWSEAFSHSGLVRPDDLDDATLAASAPNDPEAFAAIYRRYGDRLHDFCLGMLRDGHAAADCVHDVFAIAATRLGQLREHDKLRPWLYAIARHEALRRLGAHRRELPTDEIPEHASSDVPAETLAARHELSELVASASGGLSDRERTVLELHYRHGLDGPELAAALGVSATNANTLVSRLRATMRRCLGPRSLLAAVPAFVPAPLWLRHRLVSDIAPLLAPASSARGRSWWPPRMDRAARRRRALAAAVLTLGGAGAAAVFLSDHTTPPVAPVDLSLAPHPQDLAASPARATVPAAPARWTPRSATAHEAIVDVRLSEPAPPVTQRPAARRAIHRPAAVHPALRTQDSHRATVDDADVWDDGPTDEADEFPFSFGSRPADDDQPERRSDTPFDRGRRTHRHDGDVDHGRPIDGQGSTGTCTGVGDARHCTGNNYGRTDGNRSSGDWDGATGHRVTERQYV